MLVLQGEKEKNKMISVEMEDVLAVLGLCRPYLIGMAVALAAGILAMIFCRKLKKPYRFLIRGQVVIAMVLAVVTGVNLICFGPMATLIGLAVGNGTISDETNEEAAQVAEQIMEEGIVLLENEGMLPLEGVEKLNLFGWNPSILHMAGRAPAESTICMRLSALPKGWKMQDLH